MTSGNLEQIVNFLQFSPTVATAGQPTEDGIRAIAEAGHELVINLAMTGMDYSLDDEEGLVHSLGMEYVHIPVVWESPLAGDFERFREVMRENRGRRIFVHCAANMRVSAFMALYAILEEKNPTADALAGMHRIWEPNETWSRFIEGVLSENGN